MPDALATTPASANFQKLKDKLRELFELDKADLDFGIYRVLRQRHREIVEFLDRHLETTVREALRSHQSIQTDQVADDLAKAEAAAKAAGFKPDDSSVVLSLRERLKSAGDVEAVADEVYSHLLTFFSRYYQEGDFLGLHRSTVHGREKYMIPYNGEEVKLVWANMDQYYIKSSELLRDYTFLIKKSDWLAAQAELPLGDLPEQVCVHFKLVEGDTEKDNRKASGKTTRAFALADPACTEKNGALYIHFAYREHTAERALQDKLNADTVKTLADALPGVWRTLLLGADPTHQPKDKKDTRTILQKHLRAYTARHQFDYFIHKDLGGFLRRELDFYLKNEVMHLDDIENAGSSKAEQYLSKLRAIRRCATPVIRMLAQLEDFQKKLWLKKKFVVETRYCLTLDRVPEALYPEICQNDAQWQEWEELYAISTLKPKRTPEFLKANPYMMVDTGHFGGPFTFKILASNDNLDTEIKGVCLQSDNADGLRLIAERNTGKVTSINIDPPYNTGSDGFCYKDGYKSSSWLAQQSQTLPLARSALSEAGSIFAFCDENEIRHYGPLLEEVFGDKNLVETIIWNKRIPKNDKGIGNIHDYVLLLAKDLEHRRARGMEYKMRKDELEDIYALVRKSKASGLSLEDTQIELKKFYKKQGYDRGLTLYCELDPNFELWGKINMSWPNAKTEGPRYEVINPVTGLPCPIPDNGWRWKEDTFRKAEQDGPTYKMSDGSMVVGRIWYSQKSTIQPSSITYLKDVESFLLRSILSVKSDGGVTLEDLGLGGRFDYPKSVLLTERLLFSTNSNEGLILDYFGGSGTTGHAVINLNREDNGHRTYTIIEMGGYFDTVLVPRLKKVVYSAEWKDGNPQSRKTGISHAFKILRLESYEDTLNNLVLRRTPEQEAALKAQPPREQGEYMLGYFLDVESAGSASVLDVAQFRDPFAYKLKIATSSAGETKETPVDLVETFNWLLGLKVRHIDAPQGFVTVTGERRDGKKVLVIWRKLGADTVADNAALQRLFDKLQVNPAETSDTDYAAIYVNGAHTLADPHGKIHLTEEEFHRRMFATAGFDSLIN